jgi:hypothetical protein
MRSSTAGLILPLVAFLGMGSRTQAVASPAPDGPGENHLTCSSSASTSDMKVENPSDVLCRHFCGPTGCNITSLKAKKIRTLIATVPDPYRTDLRLQFDRSLDSILWAVADSGYSLESRWLPWAASASDTVSLTLSPEASSTTSGKQESLSLGKSNDRPKDEPGILLFRGERRVEEWDDVLVVFLVGETVTGGLNRQVFSEALKYIDDINADGAGDIRILGPTFSGSFDSLAKAIQDQDASKTFHFHIISGAATDLSSQRTFLGYEFGSKTVHFSTTVENDSFAIHAFVDYLSDDWWGKSGEIAVLAEDQTAYGRVTDEWRHLGREDWLFMRFPYGISRLRNSYEQENAAATLTNAQPSTPKGNAPQNLQFNLGTPEERDVIPAYSKVQSPISQEASLMSIATALQREHVSFVGIVATDVLDAVFLVRFLRKNCPDARIFMLDSDLLFARAELNTALEGVLNITSYPLFSRNQHWTRSELRGGRPRRTAFANRYAQGQYNAVREHLWEMGAILNASVQKDEILLEYRRPDDHYPGERKPPLWLTVLGRDGYWPVALLDKVFLKNHEDPESSYLEPGPSVSNWPQELKPEPPSHAWSLILALVAAASVLHSLYIWLVFLYPRPPHRWKNLKRVWQSTSVELYRFLASYPRAIADSAHTDTDPQAAQSEAVKCPPLLLVVTLVLVSVQAVIAAAGIPFIFRTSNRAFGDYSLFWVPMASLLILFAAAGSLSMRERANRKALTALLGPITNSIREGRLLIRLAWIACFTFQALWWWPFVTSWRDDDQRLFFFAYRLSHPANGVSPGLPILFLLAGLFAWGYMLVVRRATVPPPEVPKLGDSRKLAKILNKGLSEVAPSLSFIIALGVVVLWGWLFGGIGRLMSVEARSYDLLVLLLLALNYGLLFAAWAQLLGAWKNFQRFLESLERHPIHKAFSRLPKELSALPLFQKEPQKIDLCTSAQSSHTADALATESGSAFSDFHIRAVEIHRLMQRSEDQLADGLRERPDGYEQVSAVSHQLEQTVLLTANELIQWSQEEFWQEGNSDSLDAEIAAQDHPPTICERERRRILAEEFIALRIVMYIRHVLRQMRSVLWFIVADFVLTVLALSSYPFQSRRLVSVACVGVLVILGAGMVIILAQMDRNTLLSRLSDGTPHELGSSFYLRLVSFGTLPLLTVLATQFPPIAQFVSGWVQPALEALR